MFYIGQTVYCVSKRKPCVFLGFEKNSNETKILFDKKEQLTEGKDLIYLFEGDILEIDRKMYLGKYCTKSFFGKKKLNTKIGISYYLSSIRKKMEAGEINKKLICKHNLDDE